MDRANGCAARATTPAAGDGSLLTDGLEPVAAALEGVARHIHLTPRVITIPSRPARALPRQRRAPAPPGRACPIPIRARAFKARQVAPRRRALHRRLARQLNQRTGRGPSSISTSQPKACSVSIPALKRTGARAYAGASTQHSPSQASRRSGSKSPADAAPHRRSRLLAPRTPRRSASSAASGTLATPASASAAPAARRAIRCQRPRLPDAPTRRHLRALR